MRKRRIKVQTATELIAVEPYGVTAAADHSRPIMLFRVVGGEEVLPVWLSPIDAGIAITQHNGTQAGVSPHDLAIKVLQNLKVTVERCVFTEVRGHHQYVELHFGGDRELKPVLARADQAVSFSLQARAHFFATRRCLDQSKVLNVEMMGLQRDIKLKGEAAKNRHPYLN